jgi:hypothetical protein
MDHEDSLLKLLDGEPGWEPFDAPALVGGSLRFVSGDRTGARFRMRYFRDDAGHLVARVWFGPETEGPPDHAHGGSIAAVLDEVLGLAYNRPLALEVTEAGERFPVQIASSNRKVKRRISYKIIDCAGTTVIDTHDSFSRTTRVFYFTAERPGTHQLIIDEYYRSGGQTGVPASKYLNSKWVHVYRNDDTRMLGILGHVIAW